MLVRDVPDALYGDELMMLLNVVALSQDGCGGLCLVRHSRESGFLPYDAVTKHGLFCSSSLCPSISRPMTTHKPGCCSCLCSQA